MFPASGRTRVTFFAAAALCLAVGVVYSAVHAPRGRPASQEQRLLATVRQSDDSESARLNLARFHLQSRRFNDALDTCREASSKFPESAATQDLLSQALLATGRYEEAAQVLSAPELRGADLRLRKASAQLRSGDLAGAERTLTAVASQPNLTPDQRLQAAQLEFDLARFEAAALILSAPGVETAPAEAEASLGYALLASGSYKAAIPVLQRHAAQRPNTPALQYYLGAAIRLCGDRQRLPEAEAALARAVAQAPDDALIQYELALARVQLRQWEPAREAMEAAARLQPDLAEAQRDLSRLRERTGDREGAAIARSRYLRLVGDPAAAVRLMEPLAKSGDLDLTLELCEAYYDNLQTPLTLENLQRLHERHPKDIRVLQARFRGERAADHNRQALELLNQTQALLPKDDHSLDQDEIGLLRATGQYAEAEVLMRAAIQRKPNSAAAHHDLGAALARWPTGEKRDEEAEKVLLKVLELDPEHALANADLGMIMERSGRPKDAIPHLRTALDRNPLMKEALRLLGRAYATTGEAAKSKDSFALYRAVEAREREQKRLELPSSLYKATAKDRLELAAFYNRISNRSAAIVELETLLHRDPANRQARNLLIGLYGQTRRFQRQFEERRAPEPGNG